MALQYRFLWLGVYLAVMVGGVRTLGKWLVRRQKTTALSYEVMGVILVAVLASAAATEAIGVHPLFGPFSLAYAFLASRSGKAHFEHVLIR
jgi:Kef-type K+ transport system membrane component KefB